MNSQTTTQKSSDPLATGVGTVPLNGGQAARRMCWKSRLALSALENLKTGTLDVTLPDGTQKQFVGSQPGQHSKHHQAAITVHDWSVFAIAVSRGDIGFGEAYMEGRWATPDLAALLKLIAANRHAIADMIYGRWWSTLIDQVRHMLRSNRKAQARKNISAHYDLGNAFYSVWLDPTMTYSSALFDATGQWGQPVDLHAGQLNKIDRAIAQLGVIHSGEKKSVLEIGCGWGGLADRLLSQHDCSYVGLTLSTEQQQWARQVLTKHGPHRAEVRLQDYRDTAEQFDGIVSIEMFEAVGERYWDTYFKAVARCLKPNGRAVIQTITIDEHLFGRYRTNTDFIQQYIFPGGMLPSKTAFRDCAKRAGLAIENEFFFGQDYGRTLALWAERFIEQQPEIESQGFDQRFIRMWLFYLAYCEAGFAENNIDVGQFTLKHCND
jgi:cyclopropane-fatty-acyl-phospholipid synthase